jgi:hypothetical protein
MEQLKKDLKELGYELVYYEPMDAWRVIDVSDGFNNYLPTAFSKIVFRHGFVFSCSITSESNGFYVRFSANS